MSSQAGLPRLNRVEFYRCEEGDLVPLVANAIDGKPGVARSGDHEAIVAWSRMAFDVPNGGFTQFFHNNGGDRGLAELTMHLDAFELPKAANAVREARAVYRKHESQFAVANPWDGLFGSIKDFDKIDSAFMRFELRGTRAFEKWIRSNITSIASSESGEPIDAKYTGTVEVSDSNGLRRQSLEVKNGKPHGPYRDFFEDGTVRESIYYKSGKVTGDYWPDGTLKHGTTKRGDLAVIEWYQPDGQLWKRYVKNKNGFAAEPIRLFHPNGQLAEELTTVKGKKKGPWTKFFEDGSPKLKAEYVDGVELVVHDAWNDDRVQVVRDGTGVFRDDGVSIDWEYDVYIVHGWQHENELKDGIPHGKVTTFLNGILWSTAHCVNRVQDGESTLYWNNGRIHSVTRMTRGREGKTKEYPKFDRHLPAVVLTVEADEKRYTAWRHLRMDEYPAPLNLDEIRCSLVVPPFLREVDERNRAGAIKDDYEDWNRFNDGISYFLTVNATGEVTDAKPNGSGIYSGGEWETYRPLLRKLRFSPGRIRGRAMTCQVLARVDHTFVEGKGEVDVKPSAARRE